MTTTHFLPCLATSTSCVQLEREGGGGGGFSTWHHECALQSCMSARPAIMLAGGGKEGGGVSCLVGGETEACASAEVTWHDCNV